MNKSRRTQLENLIVALRSCMEDLQSIHDDESDALENMPENLSSSEKYQKMAETVDVLEDDISKLDEIITDLEDNI